MDILVTPVYHKLTKCNQPVIILEGGTRSSKTWSTIQYILFNRLPNSDKPLRVTIFRERLTWLKDTVLKDFDEITAIYNIPIEPEINPRKPDQTYYIGQHEIAFVGLDQKQKVLGRKQDISWINEVIGTQSYAVTKHTWDQIEQRTTQTMLADYNPQLTRHWLYDSVLSRPKTKVGYIHSTQLDNPFLPDNIRNKILSYEPTSENKANGTSDKHMWEVYGLGLRSEPQGVVYPNVKYTQALPDKYKWKLFGLDFGYTNNPTVLVEVRMSEGNLYIHEHFYKTGLKNHEIIELLHTIEGTEDTEIIADSSDLKAIDEIAQYFYIHGIEKPQNSVVQGIQLVKGYPLYVTESSTNLKDEYENYVWMNKKGENNEFENKPVKRKDHGMDAKRYIVMWRHQQYGSDYK